jgi:hypothetical protein
MHDATFCECNCLPYVSLHHILMDSCIYLMMQLTSDRWCILILPRTMCSTTLSHLPVMGKHHALRCMGQHLWPYHRIYQ